ncbi:FkbM family methyltransferase [Methanobacterium sp. SMA-27]|uniref:FkbM family methyltransferase n=1 Tax=Methanobacterium sp. SMA-27 TaxID=1495336 RepID=UPI0018CE1082|nr:FkbM family methyltransferase [Methanobacterium sp. SMA-27]
MELFPKFLRYKLLCQYYNSSWGKRKIKDESICDFKIRYEKKFIVNFDNMIFKFDYNPYYDIIGTPIPIYLKYYKLKKGDNIVDGGAYTGIFALIASKLVGKHGTVIAFEPDPKSYKKLINNITLNDINNIIPINKGLWSNNTILEFISVGNFGSTFIMDENIDSKIAVEVVSLDAILKKYKLKINFIKLDIEGSEVEAIKGSKHTLKNNDINLSIASYHLVKGVQTYNQLEELLTDLGYRIKTCFEGEIITYANRSN